MFAYGGSIQNLKDLQDQKGPKNRKIALTDHVGDSTLPTGRMNCASGSLTSVPQVALGGGLERSLAGVSIVLFLSVSRQLFPLRASLLG